MTYKEHMLLLGAMHGVRYLFACRVHQLETERAGTRDNLLKQKKTAKIDETRVRANQVQALIEYLAKGPNEEEGA